MCCVPNSEFDEQSNFVIRILNSRSLAIFYITMFVAVQSMHKLHAALGLFESAFRHLLKSCDQSHGKLKILGLFKVGNYCGSCKRQFLLVDFMNKHLQYSFCSCLN